jgi:hypothetical protein
VGKGGQAAGAAYEVEVPKAGSTLAARLQETELKAGINLAGGGSGGPKRAEPKACVVGSACEPKTVAVGSHPGSVSGVTGGPLAGAAGKDECGAAAPTTNQERPEKPQGSASRDNARAGSGAQWQLAATEDNQGVSEGDRDAAAEALRHRRGLVGRRLQAQLRALQRGDKLGWMRSLDRALAAANDEHAEQDGFWQETVLTRDGWQCSVYWMGQEFCGEVHRSRGAATRSAVEHAFAYFGPAVGRAFATLDTERRQRAGHGEEHHQLQ